MVGYWLQFSMNTIIIDTLIINDFFMQKSGFKLLLLKGSTLNNVHRQKK